MKGILCCLVGGVIGCVIGCNVVQKVQAQQSSNWDGCNVRYVYAGKQVVGVHDCNER